MSKNAKVIIVAVVIVILLLIGLTMLAKENKIDNEKFTIVSTNFSSYDFAKHIVGNSANVVFLLGPGVDTHGYEPSASDLKKIQSANVFIYIGGEMEQWVEKVFETDVVTDKTTLIKVTDAVELIKEEDIDGAQEEHENGELELADGAYDGHIWTAPSNAIKMVEYLSKKFCELDSGNAEIYSENAKGYVEEIKEVQGKIQDIVDNKIRDRLIFGDKMPMQYFLNEFGLKVSAAFNGCSTDAEPSVKTITYLVNKVKEEEIPVVLFIEMSTGKTAKAIAEETGAKTAQLQTIQNISKDDFINGETYVSLMYRNLEVLKEALQ